MFGIGWGEIKLFTIILIILMMIPLVFIPINTWEAAFWEYLNETAPFAWLGQMGWTIFLAAAITIGSIALEKIFLE